MDTSDITCATVTVEAGIAEVTLAATGKANRMGPEYWAQMPTLFARLDAEDAVRVVLLKGAGEHFSFGLDLASMPPLRPSATRIADSPSGIRRPERSARRRYRNDGRDALCGAPDSRVDCPADCWLGGRRRHAG